MLVPFARFRSVSMSVSVKVIHEEGLFVASVHSSEVSIPSCIASPGNSLGKRANRQPQQPIG